MKKHKARLCLRGDQQIKGIDYDEVYSPVEAWTTVHILLILSILEKLTTKQIDFTLAFVHAPIKPGTYVEMPKGYELQGRILELKRNLYGLSEAPMNFFNHLKLQLEKRGFTTSEFDPCLFINKNTGCMMFTYVDNCILFLFHKSEGVIGEVIK